MKYINRRFRIHATAFRGYLCEGTIDNYLGTKDDFEYYGATVIMVFEPHYNAQALIAIRDLGECDEFFLKTGQHGSMVDYTTQLEWI